MSRDRLGFAKRADRKLFVWYDRVFRFQPINSDALARVGHAHLEGSVSYKKAMQEARPEVQRLRDLASGLPAEQREEKSKLLQQAMITERTRRLEAFCATVQGQQALIERCTAYVCAAITGAGRILDTVPTESLPPPGALIDPDQDPAGLLMDLRDDDERDRGLAPIYIEDIRFVATEGEQNTDKGHYWVHAVLDEGTRSALGSALMDLLSFSHLMVPFRLESGGAADSGQAREEVQQHTVSSASVGPIRAGDQPRRGRGGHRARQKAG